MNQCNFCLLKDIKLNAKENGLKVVKRKSDFFLGGIDIYAIPKTSKMPKKIIAPCDEYPNGDKFRQDHLQAWLMEIPSKCKCE